MVFQKETYSQALKNGLISSMFSLVGSIQKNLATESKPCYTSFITSRTEPSTKASTWAIVSGSSGLWSLKPEYCPDDVDLLMGGLSIFLRESCRLMLVRLPWPGRRLLSGLSLLRPRFCSRPRGWLARLGDPRSTEELERACGGWRGQWPSLVLPGRLTGGGGSPLFLCLDVQREREREREKKLVSLSHW